MNRKLCYCYYDKFHKTAFGSMFTKILKQFFLNYVTVFTLSKHVTEAPETPSWKIKSLETWKGP